MSNKISQRLFRVTLKKRDEESEQLDYKTVNIACVGFEMALSVARAAWHATHVVIVIECVGNITVVNDAPVGAKATPDFNLYAGLPD